jgi:hypothetical protein
MPRAAAKIDLAQVGAGDDRVVAGPGYREIPKCKLPLRTEAGQREYDTTARLLFDAGRFDHYHHSQLSLYAIAFDEMQVAVAAGRPVRGEMQKQIQRAFEKLGINDLNKPIAAPTGAPTNKFASCGFSARRL